ncbi:hypothetical protein ACVCEP_09935 [Escherichia coli]
MRATLKAYGDKRLTQQWKCSGENYSRRESGDKFAHPLQMGE